MLQGHAHSVVSQQHSRKHRTITTRGINLSPGGVFRLFIVTKGTFFLLLLFPYINSRFHLSAEIGYMGAEGRGGGGVRGEGYGTFSY